MPNCKGMMKLKISYHDYVSLLIYGFEVREG